MRTESFPTPGRLRLDIRLGAGEIRLASGQAGETIGGLGWRQWVPRPEPAIEVAILLGLLHEVPVARHLASMPPGLDTNRNDPL